jgi:hypothetical protein
MWILSFYRLYISLFIGCAVAFFIMRTWWFGAIIAVVVRITIGIAESIAGKMSIERSFKAHAFMFKQELGPYGIRMINRAEKDAALRKSLAEVFVDDEKKLKKAVEQLEMMDTLFKAGMCPDADTWQLHDLKLKYGKCRIAQIEKRSIGK